ncbi:PepSY domain-containing protein [Pollutimonas bauzanensis]|uniref:PepSY domain-containing protein n=1 Tax=Pollutimonas bauzanensis TaxID=658167 RepID=UPI00333E76F4
MTTFWSRFKRAVYLVHRWAGIAACVLMTLWFISGVVMLFVGYPKFTPWERLAALPALETPGCCISVDKALSQADDPASVQEIVLTSIAGIPHYKLRQSNGRYQVVNAISGQSAKPADAQHAMRAARVFIPGADAAYLGQIHEDTWTHSGSLNIHRPLHRVQLNDKEQTLLYVSSSTGEVVMDAPRFQRAWNYVGAWLHWLYVFRSHPVDPLWSWTVIALSATGVLAALTGTLAGLWRWRFGSPYKSGSRSPYRGGYLRWHHLSGLMFAAITCTWIFSGLMSMNPVGIFSPQERPNLSAYRGGTPGTAHLPLDTSEALAMLSSQGFHASEIEWRAIGGIPYLLARDAANTTRLIMRSGPVYALLAQWPDTLLLQAAPRLMDAHMVSHQRIDHYDSQYYSRATQSMYGAAERRLPALRVDFDDAEKTSVYLDLYSGDVELSSSQSQRTGRWLFNFLHSWDIPPMLQAGTTRNIALILLSLGGLVLCLTGVKIGYARLRTRFFKPQSKGNSRRKC